MTVAQIQEYLKIVVDLTKALVWPVFGLIIANQFKDVIVAALNRSKAVNLKFAGVEIAVSEEEAAGALSGFIDDILNNLLTPTEKTTFLRILACPAPPSVITIFPGFSREASVEDLKTLRALRGAALIRPLEGGKWERETSILVTDSGRLVGLYKREVLESSKSSPVRPAGQS